MSDNHESGYPYFGMPEKTEFDANVIAIDPAGCRCTDCIVGHAVNIDDAANMERVAKAAAFSGRKVVNRSGTSIALIYRDVDGSPAFIPTEDVHTVIRTISAR